MADEVPVVVPNKIIAVPVCWALYLCPANVFEILGGSVSTPPPIVLEAMVSNGMAKIVKYISSDVHDHSEDEEGETSEGEDSPSDENPWYPGA